MEEIMNLDKSLCPSDHSLDWRWMEDTDKTGCFLQQIWLIYRNYSEDSLHHRSKSNRSGVRRHGFSLNHFISVGPQLPDP